MPKWYLDITFLYLLFSVVNLLNYIDRGIIPGATNEINNFIQDSVDTDKPDVFLGLLQSSFIIGFMLGSVLFGNMVHTYSRFTLTGIGCSIWILAVMLSGCAFYANSYVFLLFARIISGFGEASMQCSIPPWISATASPHNRGLWLGIFYTAIPVGTAIGYAYSATLATTVGWQWAFFVEGLVMFPFVLFMFSIAKDFPCDMTDHQAEDVNTALLGENSVVGVAAGPPSLWEECRQVMHRPVFIFISFAAAAQAATLIGISTFGSAFVMGLGFFNDEATASTTFGAVVSVAGLVGTPLGGYLLDRLLVLPGEGHAVRGENRRQLYRLSLFVAAFTFLGGVVFALQYFVYDKLLYLAMLGIGGAVCFICTPAISLGAMLAVPLKHRAFAIALNIVYLHALGDVPSPVIVGLIKDYLAPGCVPDEGADDDGNIAASDACRNDGHGLRITLLLTVVWIFWVVVFFVIAAMMIRTGTDRACACGGLDDGHLAFVEDEDEDEDDDHDGLLDGNGVDSEHGEGGIKKKNGKEIRNVVRNGHSSDGHSSTASNGHSTTANGDANAAAVNSLSSSRESSAIIIAPSPSGWSRVLTAEELRLLKQPSSNNLTNSGEGSERDGQGQLEQRRAVERLKRRAELTTSPSSVTEEGSNSENHHNSSSSNNLLHLNKHATRLSKEGSSGQLPKGLMLLDSPPSSSRVGSRGSLGSRKSRDQALLDDVIDI